MSESPAMSATLGEVAPAGSVIFGAPAVSRVGVPPFGGGDLGRLPKRGAHDSSNWQKRPIANHDDLNALIESARALSREHWEVVTILYKTGIEMEGLRKLTWRDLGNGMLVWKRHRRREEVVFRMDDPDLLAAVRGFVRRPQRSSDQLDRLVKQARDASGRASLAGVTPLSLRLTRALSMLEEGMSQEAVERTLNLKPAVVRGVARYRRGATDREDEVREMHARMADRADE